MNIEIKNKILEVLSKEGGYFGLSAELISKKVERNSRSVINNYLNKMVNNKNIIKTRRGYPPKTYYISKEYFI